MNAKILNKNTPGVVSMAEAKMGCVYELMNNPERWSFKVGDIVYVGVETAYNLSGDFKWVNSRKDYANVMLRLLGPDEVVQISN